MQKKILQPFILTVCAFFILGIVTFALDKNGSVSKNGKELLMKITESFNSVMGQRQEERVYLQLDKSFYAPGETIWFSAFLRNGKDLMPSIQSDILYAELYNPKGSLEKQLKLITKKGMAAGDFTLAQGAAGGVYKIRAYTNWQKNDPEPAYFEREIQVQTVMLPRIKMKLDFDRKAFGKGEEVIARVNFQTLENKPISYYNFRYTVTLEGKKYLEETGITSAEGEGYIQFTLPQQLQSTDGLLNVMIDHEGSTEAISRSVPIVLNRVDISFYPEGGDLVWGLPGRVAFKALNESGKAADVEGVIENDKGEKICSFKSFHMGMGAFPLIPGRNEKYFARITSPKDISQVYELPEPLEKGYSMQVLPQKDELLLEVSTTEQEELAVVCVVRDKIYFSHSFQATAGSNKIRVPLAEFPIGVAQITLFDHRGIERCERLAFVNKHKQLKVKIGTDKERYLPREKVKMTLKVTDDKGLPMPAGFSIAVADDKVLSFADDRQGHLLSRLLLEYDVKGKIEEPNFYFDPSEPAADEALDYVMMTSGWRRFTWKQILDDDLPPAAFRAEKALVSGTVADQNGRPVKKAKLEVTAGGLSAFTDSNGYFILKNIELYDPVSLRISAPGFSDQYITVAEYNRDLRIFLYNRQRYYGYPAEAAQPALPGQAVKRERMMRAEENVEDKIFMNVPPAMMNAEEEKAVAAEGEQVVEGVQIKDGRGMDQEAEPADDEEADRFIGGYAKGKKRVILPGPVVSGYYRAREFPATVYENTRAEIRHDFRTTVFWKGNVETDRSGRAIVEFYNGDAISSFRITAEGIGADGMPGRAEHVYYTQLPFSVSLKCPEEVISGDMISLPVTIKNNTPSELKGIFSLKLPEGLVSLESVPSAVRVAASSFVQLLIPCKAAEKTGKGKIEAGFGSEGLHDGFSQEISILAKGFPASIALSGQDTEKEFTFHVSNMVAGSMHASFKAYPSVMTDLLQDVENLVREPYGCFEQTSRTNYPNILVKQYIKAFNNPATETGSRKVKMPAGLDEKLDRGYQKLVSYETREKGYEWFGGAPGHEALTAYGLMQFHDMAQVYDKVDEAMINRTAEWLLSRRDGQGGFLKNSRALDEFGRASEEISNAYIVYALSEAGFSNIGKEAGKAFEEAWSNKDPYQLALMANAMFNMKEETKGTKLIRLLESLQSINGSWTGTTHSITRSQGNSLTIETTALSAMALMKSTSADQGKLNKAIEYLISSRGPYGEFGSTQGTVLALKALTMYSIFSKRTSEDGTIEIYIDGKKVVEKHYKAGEQQVITADLGQHLTEGKHKVRIRYSGVKNPLPFTFAVNYHTTLPNSSSLCKVSLKTDLEATSVKTGETVRLTAILSNKTKEGLPMNMGIVGLPAGLSAQPWQLKELQEKKQIDFYEVKGNAVLLYFRQLKPEEIKTIHLDLKGEVAGEFEAPSSCAYLYYTNEYKSWSRLQKIRIKG